MTPEKLTEIVNQSGFPLQIAIETMVGKTKSRHGWVVRFREHAWAHPANASAGFLDLVVTNDAGVLVFAMECKRVQETSWVFLVEQTQRGEERHAKAWVSRYAREKFAWFDWFNTPLDPMSYESGFCVVDGQDPKTKQPMLERIGAELVFATEALALEEKPILPKLQQDVFRLYFSVVVTTARLQVCLYDPDNASLHDGKFTGCRFVEVPFVRFRKQLSTLPIPLVAAGWDPYTALAQAKEHTVFVVNAEALYDFLCRFKVDSAAFIQMV